MKVSHQSNTQNAFKLVERFTEEVKFKDVPERNAALEILKKTVSLHKATIQKKVVINFNLTLTYVENSLNFPSKMRSCLSLFWA